MLKIICWFLIIDKWGQLVLPTNLYKSTVATCWIPCSKTSCTTRLEVGDLLQHKLWSFVRFHKSLKKRLKSFVPNVYESLSTYGYVTVFYSIPFKHIYQCQKNYNSLKVTIYDNVHFSFLGIFPLLEWYKKWTME